MKDLIIILTILFTGSSFCQTSLMTSIDRLPLNKDISFNQVNHLFKIDTIGKSPHGTRFSISRKFYNSKKDILTIVLNEDYVVCHYVYLYSVNNNEIIDSKQVEFACDAEDYNAADIVYFHTIEDKTVTIEYIIQSTTSQPQETLNIQHYKTYVQINENGYFFEKSTKNLPTKSREFAFASNTILTPDSLSKYTRDELAIMRNEIFASYGYKFKTDRYRLYFESLQWYHPNLDNVLDKLTDIEKNNIDLIKKLEKIKKGL